MNLIKEIREKTGLNNKQIAETIGKSPQRISFYLHGGDIPKEVSTILTDTFEIDKPDKFECELENVSVYEASKRTGISEHFIRLGLQQEKLDFGTAIKGDSNAYQYYIWRGALENYIKRNK